jgi:glycosyltransferase involved in cell wall biosynthesis
MRIKKIIHLITTIERGGAEKQLLILAQKQIELGLEVEIIYLKGAPELKKDFDIARCKVNDFISNRNFVFQILALSKLLRKSPTPVHAHLPKSELIASLVCPKKSFVVTRHNSENFWPKAPKSISKLISKFICSRASKVISISNAVKRFIIETGEVSKNCKVDVIHYASDLNSVLSPIGLFELSSRISKSSKTFKIGSIGRLVDQKDYPTLLMAFRELLINHPESELYIVGNGSKKRELELLVRKLEIYEKVFFIGRTKYIAEFLSLIDLFVLPSRYEGFGLVLLEAMSAKKPILASNNSSIPEVLGLGFPGLFKTGSVHELVRKIELTITDKNFVNNLINQYSVQLKKFEPTQMAKSILKLYEESLFKF